MMKDVGMSLKSQLLASLVGLFVKLNTSPVTFEFNFFTALKHCDWSSGSEKGEIFAADWFTVLSQM